MRCAIYVRVSTDEQAKAGYSLAAQVDRIKAFIKSQGYYLNGPHLKIKEGEAKIVRLIFDLA